MARKVLIFSLAYFPKHVGGAEIALKEITDRIASTDVEFHMITNRFDSALPRTEVIGNVHVHRVGFGVRGADISATHAPLFYVAKIMFVPLASWKGRALVRREQIDLCWAMMTYMMFPIVLMRLLGVRIPYLLTLQEGDPFEHVFERWYIRAFRPLLSYGFRHAAAIQCISHFLADWARAMGARCRVIVVPNGVDGARFSAKPGEDEARQAESVLARKPGQTLLVTTSRLVHKNAVDVIIDALQGLPDDVRLIIFGQGPDETTLKEQVQRLGVNDRVSFMGELRHSQLPAHLHACDIFVRPSRSEGMGNSFVEAMSAGLPVIATQEGGIADFLFDATRNPEKRTTGWAVDKDSPEQIAQAVRVILADREKVHAVVENARALVAERYDWKLISEQIHGIIKKVVPEKQS